MRLLALTLFVSSITLAQTAPRAALEKKYPGATISALTRDANDFEARVTTKGRTLEVKVTAEGRVVEEEERISLKQAPEAVATALAKSAQAKWKVVAIEKVIRDEQADAPLYEIELSHGGKTVELLFDADGNPQPKR